MKRILLPLLFVLLSLAGLSTTLHRTRAQPAGTIALVAVSSEGMPGNQSSLYPSVSANGRYVVFQSSSTNLVEGDTNNVADAFLRDRETGETTRITVGPGGEEGNFGLCCSGHPIDISADGRYVAFSTFSSNLVISDTNQVGDVFVRDLQTGETTRVSVSSAGEATNRNASFPSISDNGRHVAFITTASNLVAGDTNEQYDVFVHDRQTAETVRVSVTSGGTESTGESLVAARAIISHDGRYVVFQSQAGDLVPGDTNGHMDVFVRDRDTDSDGIFDEPGAVSTTRVSVASDGSQALTGDSMGATISANGRYVTFQSAASDLVAGDSGQLDIFIHDLQTGETDLVSTAPAGAPANGSSYNASISADGRYVAFASTAFNLVPDDTNLTADLFRHDRQTGETIRITMAYDGSQLSGPLSASALISGDGGSVVFDATATDLVPNDTNGAIDAFIYTYNPPVSGNQQLYLPFLIGN